MTKVQAEEIFLKRINVIEAITNAIVGLVTTFFNTINCISNDRLGS